MSASVPPLAAMITARPEQRVFWASGVIAGVVLAEQAQPGEAVRVAGERIMLRATLRFFPPVSSHASEGRMTSAPTRTSRELVISSSRDAENMPLRCSHLAGPCRPFLACGVGAAGKPALLPGVAGLVLQPVQQHRQPSPVIGLNPRLRQRADAAATSSRTWHAVVPGGRPVRHDGPGGEPGRQPWGAAADRALPARRWSGRRARTAAHRRVRAEQHFQRLGR